jgi:peptidyl-prolyl cis-trans isomerase D
VPPQLIDDALLSEAALSELIRRELMRQEADRAGFRVGDDLLFTGLQDIEAFQENGRFSASRYEQVLGMQRRSKAGFEAQLREGIRLSQLEDGIRGTAFATAAAARDFRRLQGQRRDIAYLRIDPEAFVAQIEPSEDELQVYYDEHAELFQRPERVRLAYVELSVPELASSVNVAEQDLRAYYEEQIDRYTVPEERRASHILLSLGREASESEVSAAQAEAESLLERLRSGESFAELARGHSDDSLSASQGGDLGVIREGDQPPAFEQALRELALDAVSQPVRTEFGVHLIKLTALEPGRTRDFEEVREALESEYRRHEAETVFIDYADELTTVSYEVADSLEPAADAIGTTVETSDWITRADGEGIAADPRIRQLAFSAEVLEDGRNSDLIELSDNQAVVLRVLEHEPAARLPLEQVREQARARLIEERAREQARELGERLLEELRNGAAIESMAERPGASVETPGLLARDDGTTAPEILRRAFSLSRPEPDGTSLAGLGLGDGSYVVVVVRAVEDGDSESGLGPARAQLGGDYSRREEQAFFDAMRERAEVQVFRDEP